ncbi:hypothetical protein [Streptomyces sp. NPDC018610]|uniref:hypothetical protein n=1 Tax=Streptomyces sp. NPDC018610 TaxID=3365049 RepID=UPI00378C2DEF
MLGVGIGNQRSRAATLTSERLELLSYDRDAMVVMGVVVTAGRRTRGWLSAQQQWRNCVRIP